jgi:hypothetical protein
MPDVTLRNVINTGDPITAPDGTALAGVQITFQLVDVVRSKTVSLFDAVSGELIVGDPVTVVTDIKGEFTVPLWPNSRGESVTVYKVSIDDENIKPFLIRVDDLPSTLSLVSARASMGQIMPQVIGLMQASINEATESAATAGIYAASAATSANSAAGDAAQVSSDRTDVATNTGTATTKAGEATTSATNAASSATAAAGSATAAGTSAGDAANSATAAAGSATTATTQAGSATTKAGEASTSATSAASSATAAAGSATAAGTSAGDAANSATAAAGSATTATTQAGTATTKAGEASTSATSAASSATAAAGSATTATTQSGTATTQAGIATTKAGEAATSAANAAATLAGAVPKTTTVNGHALTGNVSITAADIALGNVTNESKATMFANPVFTGIEQIPAGSAPAPSLTTPGDTDTGLFFPTANTVGIACGGVEVARFSIAGTNVGVVNDIGIPGTAGFGVGVCPNVPAGFAPMYGCTDKFSDNYGNYMVWDGSIMVWIPAFYYKYGTGANGFALNIVDIKPYSAYADVATANAAGYALHRAFYDGGAIKQGFFVDKFQCSNNGGIASSIRNGKPLSTAADHNPLSALTGAPANFYYGAITAAKTRGAGFFCNSRFIWGAIALLSLAHASASTSTTWCGWYNATYNFPKGCNNNALGDTNDAAVLYASDGYSNCGRTGSANLFNCTTHNGQNSGVCDLNGNMWEITPGLTSNGTNYYVLKTTTAMKNLTGGNTLATDLWGATGIAALYDSLGATYEAATASSTNKPYGSAAQVLSAATSGLAWQWAGLGQPLAGGVGGSNQYGSDGFWDYRPNELCALSGGDWGQAAVAGVWACYLGHVRSSSIDFVGFRSALYL